MVSVVRNMLVTGASGFIGFHLSMQLLAQGEFVVGLDNLNSYYDVKLKEARLSILKKNRNFQFIKANLADREAMATLFNEYKFDIVFNLAAQAGVRYSLINPHAYIESNIVGFMNILEGCRHQQVRHLIFASSSSVYGANTKTPFSIHDNVDHPLSLYAATKKANELMAHTYAALYRLPCTGLRFFTVYGPWGRPDMAYFLFTKAILEDRPIDVFNEGRMKRDFTYVDDIVEGVVRLIEHIPTADPTWQSSSRSDPSRSFAPYKLYNIGNNHPVALMEFIEILEGCLGKKARMNFLPLQAGDVPVNFADVDDLVKDVGFRPATPIEEGIKRFIAWYLNYYCC